MKIKIYDSKEECLNAGAWAFMRYALNHKNPVIGVCTGTTTEPIHRIVAEMYKKNPFDASGLHTFNADEYCSPKDAGVVCSMRPRMEGDLWGPLSMDDAHCHLPNPLAEDWDAECEKYEEEIRSVGGIGLQMLGVGPDAHLGFCLPGTSFGSTTHVTALSADVTGKMCARFNLDAAKYGPFNGITMGLKTFMQGKITLPITVGTNKAEAVANAILGPVTEAVPASILQLHPNCTWLMDKEAAEGIIGRIDENGVRIK